MGWLFLKNPKDSVWEDWGRLGKILGITSRGPLRIPLRFSFSRGRFCFFYHTLPGTNSEFTPENRPFAPKGNESSSNHGFSGAMFEGGYFLVG